MRRVASVGATMIRADAPLYAFILLYTAFGVGYLDWTAKWDAAAYATYVGHWLVLFAVTLPVLALIVDFALLLHRFERRRRLAARYVFSSHRIGSLLAGMALLQGMVLFQGTFTTVKNLLPVTQSGFPYDRIQADIDKALHFGVDPWRWLNSFAAYDWVRIAVEWNYSVLFFALCFGGLFFMATSPAARAVRMRYLFEFMLVWIVVGNLLAGLFLSAGPAFYGLVTGDEARFGEQLQFLARGLGSPDSSAGFQAYLWELHISGKAGLASGISAFPSVHVALIAMNALFLRDHDRRLGLAGFAYTGLIMASSVYLGWHYAIDGYVAVMVVVGIHFALKWADRAIGMLSRLHPAAADADLAWASDQPR
jgi:small basic protein